jgi:hypothetical protein
VTFEKIVSEDRCIFIGRLDDGIPEDVSGSLAVLLTAFSNEECRIGLSMIPVLVEKNCTQIVCVGRFSEQLHDEIDSAIEDMRRPDILTTFHTDAAEACEYFVYAVGSVTSTLLALISNHLSLVDILKKTSADR